MRAFESYHPFVTFVYFLSVITVTMFVMNPIIEITALVGALLFCLTGRKKSDRLKSVLFYLLTFFLVTLTNPFFSHFGDTKLFSLGSKSITLEALLYGAGIGMTIIGVMLWCRILSEVMTSDKLLFLFSQAMPRLSLVISSALGFIPTFKKRLYKVSRAQKAMGLYSSDGFFEKVKSTGKVFVSMIAWSLESSIEASSSMKARGYKGKDRSNFSIFKFEHRDAVFLLVCVLLLSAVLFGVSKEAMKFEYYPTVTKIHFTPVAALSYLSFAALSALPFIIEVKEALLWKYCVSKI